MKYIITEQQASEIFTLYRKLIKDVLEQKDIYVKDVEITPIYFPRGLKVIVKLEKGQDKELARKLIKGIVGSLSGFGQREVSLP